VILASVNVMQKHAGTDASNERQRWNWYFGATICIQLQRTLGN